MNQVPMRVPNYVSPLRAVCLMDTESVMDAIDVRCLNRSCRASGVSIARFVSGTTVDDESWNTYRVQLGRCPVCNKELTPHGGVVLE